MQFAVASVLDELGVLWCHVPNEGQAVDVRPGQRPTPEQSRRLLRSCQLVAQGVKAGVPDVLIFSSPPAHPGCLGVALELKTQVGRPSSDQQRWLGALAGRGWAAYCERGTAAALGRLRALGWRVDEALGRLEARGWVLVGERLTKAGKGAQARPRRQA